MKTLIIIPIFNEEKNITRVLDRLELEKNKFDVLIVDDGSTDNSYNVCLNKDRVSVIKLSSNLGIGGARQAGFKYAHSNNYDVVVQLDGDDQHNPDFIDNMIEKLNEGNNICIGSRFIDYEGFQSSFFRRLGIYVIYNLIKLITGQRFTDPTSGFRACDRAAIELFAKDYPQDYPEPESIVFAANRKIKICEVPVTMNERGTGKSSIGGFSSVYFMAKVSIAILLSLPHNNKELCEN